MPYALSVTACCVLLSIILPFCFSEQDLLDILLVRHSVDYYHCDCRPNLQTTTAFQLQIAKWVIAVNIQYFLVLLYISEAHPKKWKHHKTSMGFSSSCLQIHVLASSLSKILHWMRILHSYQREDFGVWKTNIPENFIFHSQHCQIYYNPWCWNIFWMRHSYSISP